MNLGRDEWAGYDTVIAVGREEPRPIDVERVARAIWADDPRPLHFIKDGRFIEVLKGYRLRDDSRKGVKTSIHPNPRVQRVLQLIRENEIVQAIDRLRLIHNDLSKRVIILCSIPLDITVDELRTLDELAATPGRLGWCARLESALETGGILPLGPRDLHRAYPDLFPSEARAKDALHLARKAARVNGATGANGGRNQIRLLFGNHPHLRVAEYRRHNQHGRASRALYHPHRVVEPQITLSRMLGDIVVDWGDIDAGPPHPSHRRPDHGRRDAHSRRDDGRVGHDR